MTHINHSSAGHHAGHGAQIDHSGHEQMFRRRFWVSLALTLPVLLYSPMLQEWLGFAMPVFPGSRWIAPLLSVVIFLYGGVPFLQMAAVELRQRQPGMMTLISMAISVAFVYSLGAVFLVRGSSFFWELVTLIDVMLLGHWIEVRSVRQASGALDELARLMPDTAERVGTDSRTETVPVSEPHVDDLVPVRPGAQIPTDGAVVPVSPGPRGKTRSLPPVHPLHLYRKLEVHSCPLVQRDFAIRHTSAGERCRTIKLDLDAQTTEARTMVEEEMQRFTVWLRTQEVGQTMAALQRQAVVIRESELLRLSSRLAHLSSEDLQAIEAALCGTLNKLLHGPIIHLTEAAASGNGGREVATVRAVFGLEDGAAQDGDRLAEVKGG